MVTYGRPGVFTTENFSPLTAGGGAIPGEAMPGFCAAYPRGPIKPITITSFQQFTLLYGDFTTDPGNYLPYALQQFFLNGGTQCFVLRLANTDATDSSLQLADIEDSPENIVEVISQSPGVWGTSIYIEIASAGIAGRFNFNVYLSGSTASNLVETFQDLSTNPTDRRYCVTMINSPTSGSNFVTLVETLPEGGYVSGQTDLNLISPTPLTGGSDGVVAPDESVVAPDIWDTLINQALYLNFPGLYDASFPAKWDTLNSWAAGRDDTMLIIDGPAPILSQTTAQITGNYTNMVSGGSSLPVSTYLTVYAPWLLCQDPSSTVPGATVFLPPGGQVLAAWQTADQLYGTVQSPAGVNFSVKVVDLEARFSNAQLDTLNDELVNAIKFIPGLGFLIFGARTLHPSYPDRYVAVRRMLIKLEHDFQWLLLPGIFQPNDAQLWKWVENTLNSYLTTLLQADQLGGDSAADSFLVVCDNTNNTPSTAQAGIVNVNVAVSLLSPAEFIEIELSLFQGSGTASSNATTGATS